MGLVTYLLRIEETQTCHRIWVDFMKTDGSGRLLLTAMGTREDLKRLGIELREGLLLKLYSDDADEAGVRNDLIVDGSAHFDDANRHWVAEIDWNAIRHQSEIGAQ